jgi:signal transduction histidine kinase
MTRVLDETLDTVQRIAADLRPGVLDELGLKAAIQWQLDDFSRRAGIRCRFDASLPSATAIEPVRATAAFRIFQELLTNVARHAEAQNVRVRLTARNGRLELEVTDDGRGIRPENAAGAASFGLRAARERAAQLGGALSIDSSRRKGAAIRVTIPL